METKLARISQMSRENPTMIFTSIGHLINKEMLRSCNEAMDGTKAKGIDGVSKADYEEHLDENLDRLVDRLKRKAYHPQLARRVEIPKDNGKTRPLSIYCYEDKLAQEALKRILEAVFEPMFYDEMMGFRPNRNCHMALRKLNVIAREGIHQLCAGCRHQRILRSSGSWMDYQVCRIENQGSEHHQIDTGHAESRDHEGLRLRGNRRRIGPRLGL